MSKLIKNELIKIFKKKSIYITLVVILGFVILTNCIYKFFYQDVYNTSYSEEYMKYTKEELAKLDPNKPSDARMYIDLKTQVDVFEKTKEYDKDDWQIDIIGSQMATYINEKNTYLYGENKDSEKVAQIEEKINQLSEKLQQDDWKYFAQKDLEQAEETLKQLENQKSKTQDKQQLQQLILEIENAKIDKKVAEYRVKEEIKYGNDFRNIALNQYQSEAKSIITIDKSPNAQQLSHQEKREYNETLASREINQYIIENNVDVNKTNDIRGILENFFNEYGLFIIVMIVMIAGTIVSEEFNKGTIKLLLIKPYSRKKILLSKFITVLIMILFSIAIIILMELLVGGIVFGYDSLSVPILQYNFETQNLETISIFSYLGIQIITQLPKLILLATLAFACSTLFTNSAVAIAIPLLGYMSADVINMLVIQYKVDFMKIFVSLNWDFNEYLYGNLPKMEGMTLGFSILICTIYFLAMIIPTFIAFKKKNIKNI